TEGTPGGTEHILLVDDEKNVREAVAHTMELSGYRVVAAANGEEALRFAAMHAGLLHLLLTDVVMPGISGRELANRLSRIRPQTRVLFMSGHTEDAILRHGVRNGEVAFLQKPVTPGALLRKVREVLDAAAPHGL
ncbi:MAG: response regulator, partial [Armatimonadetes bacterium]|nr:response regulator [Armatimonadota bacterium]